MIVVAVSASRTNTMQTCWMLYNYSYNARWTPNEKAEPLERGDLIHTFFKHFYREKMKGRIQFNEEQFGIVLDEASNLARRAAVEYTMPVSDADDYIRAARQNLIFHRGDGMLVHAVEEPFSKIIYEIPDRERKISEGGGVEQGIRILFEGITDLVATIPNQPLSVWDHKSEARRKEAGELDNQFTGMAWAFNVDTVVVNKVGLQESLKDNEKHRRIWLDYSPKHLIEEWKRDLVGSVLEAVERHKMELRGQAAWPRNRTACRRFGRKCEFYDVCKAKPPLRPVKLQTWFHIKPEHELFSEDGKKEEVAAVEG